MTRSFIVLGRRHPRFGAPTTDAPAEVDHVSSGPRSPWSVAGFAVLVSGLAFVGQLSAQVPQLINYQGRVAVDNVNFEGAGQFKFALVDGTGAQTFWSNDSSSTAGSEPATAVSLTVAKGLYSVLLGDATLANMTVIPASVFTNPDVRLRVWFNDGVNGWQQLTPDQRIAAVGYALMAGNVPDATITSAKLAPGAVTSASLATGSITADKIAAGTVIAPQGVSDALQAVTPNTTYEATGTELTTFVLPATATVGDVVEFSGTGSGGWSVVSEGQTLGGTAIGFIPRESPRNWQAVASSADGTKLVAAVYGGQLYTSTDSGATWTSRESNRNWYSVASSTDGTKLIAADIGVSTGGQLYTSTDAGVTWTARESSRLWSSVASSADGSRLIAADSTGQLYISADSGATWTPHESNRFWLAVASSATGADLVAVENGGKIYTSNNYGSTWYPRDADRSWYCVACSADGSTLIAGGLDERLYLSSDRGGTWTPREFTRWWGAVAVSADGSRFFAAEDGGQIYVSTDSGLTWLPQEANRSWAGLALSTDGTRVLAAAHGDHLYCGQPAFAGTQGSRLALQYLGSGQWSPVSDKSAVPSGAVLLSANPSDPNLIAAGYVKLAKVDVDNVWKQGSSSPPTTFSTVSSAVWTGADVIVWGRNYAGTLGACVRYNPTSDTWSSVSMTGAPSVRWSPSVVWTGSDMIVWGGQSSLSSTLLADGARYNPATNTWSPMTTSGAPAAREYATALWTGTEVIVWGGGTGSGEPLASGARYNPSTDTWSSMSTSGGPEARFDYAAVWAGETGTMYLWGGRNSSGTPLFTGFSYEAATNSWNIMSTVGAPPARAGAAAVWTGSRLVLWGGSTASGYLDDTWQYFQDPSTYGFRWVQITAPRPPSPREYASAIWTGSEMVIMGGASTDPVSNDFYGYTDGGALTLSTNPAAGTWNLIPNDSVSPVPILWTGGEMISIGIGSDNRLVLWTYLPKRTMYLYQRP